MHGASLRKKAVPLGYPSGNLGADPPDMIQEKTGIRHRTEKDAAAARTLMRAAGIRL